MIQTAKDVQRMVEDRSNVRAMRALFAAIAYQETVRGIIEPKQREILSFYKFPPASEVQERRGNSDPILEPSKAYLLSDEDFTLYDKEMKAFYPTVGFKDMGDFCPLLVAESTVRNVKREIADLLQPYFGFGYDKISWNMERYAKYFELLLQMFAGAVKELESKEVFVKASQ